MIKKKLKEQQGILVKNVGQCTNFGGLDMDGKTLYTIKTKKTNDLSAISVYPDYEKTKRTSYRFRNCLNHGKAHRAVITTHSPYILDILLEKENYDYGLFYVHSSENGSIVKTATEEDVQDMYEAGVDAFFNIERLGDEA